MFHSSATDRRREQTLPEALGLRQALTHEMTLREVWQQPVGPAAVAAAAAGSRVQLATFLEGLVRGVPLLRPAVLAAIELGAGPALD